MKKLVYGVIACSIIVSVIFIVSGLLLHYLPLVMFGVAMAVGAAVVYQSLEK